MLMLKEEIMISVQVLEPGSLHPSKMESGIMFRCYTMAPGYGLKPNQVTRDIIFTFLLWKHNIHLHHTSRLVLVLEYIGEIVIMTITRT